MIGNLLLAVGGCLVPLAAGEVDALRARLAAGHASRRTTREAARKADATAKRESAYAAATARDFADTDAAGYVDRTGLEGS